MSMRMWTVGLSCVFLSLSCTRPISSQPTVAPPAEQAPGAESPASHSETGSGLVCDNPVYDFGTVWAGEIITHEFEVRNTGPDTVWVRVLIAGAISMRAEIHRIDPQGTARIPLSLNTRYFQGPIAMTARLVLIDPPPGQD